MLLVSIYAGCAGFTVIVAVEEVEGGMGRICKWQNYGCLGQEFDSFWRELPDGRQHHPDGWVAWIPAPEEQRLKARDDCP